MKRKAGTVSMLTGTVGVVGTIRSHDKKVHPISGASVEIVTNRSSGLLVEVRAAHAGYRVGEQVQIGDRDFIRV